MEGTTPPATSSAFSVRPATEDDIAIVAAIEAKVHQPAPWTADHFKKELEKPYSRFLLLTDDETDSVIAGYIVFWLIESSAEILDVVVDLEHRGQGMAKKLIRHAIDEALRAGHKRMTLDVRRSNAAAIQLYQSLGFTISAVRKAFYSNQEDAYQMTLSLEGERIEF